MCASAAHSTAHAVCLVCPAQTLVKLRRVRYGKHKDDASVVLLGDTDVLGQDGRSLPPAQTGLLPPVSMLILRCAKNYGTQLLPLPAPSA